MPKAPLRERRYHDTLKTLERARRRREGAIRMLVRYEALIPKLERKARRLGAPPTKKTAPPSALVDTKVLPTIEPKIEDDGIPDFLRRTAEGKAKDDAARAEIIASQEKRAKKKKVESAERRAAIKKETAEHDAIPTSKRRWDINQSRWISD